MMSSLITHNCLPSQHLFGGEAKNERNYDFNFAIFAFFKILFFNVWIISVIRITKLNFLDCDSENDYPDIKLADNKN